jgi:uncharacterized membrane protein
MHNIPIWLGLLAGVIALVVVICVACVTILVSFLDWYDGPHRGCESS